MLYINYLKTFAHAHYLKKILFMVPSKCVRSPALWMWAGLLPSSANMATSPAGRS